MHSARLHSDERTRLRPRAAQSLKQESLREWAAAPTPRTHSKPELLKPRVGPESECIAPIFEKCHFVKRFIAVAEMFLIAAARRTPGPIRTPRKKCTSYTADFRVRREKPRRLRRIERASRPRRKIALRCQPFAIDSKTISTGCKLTFNQNFYKND